MATIRKRGSTWHVQVRKRGHSTLTRTFRSKKAADVWARELERATDLGELSTVTPQKVPMATLGEVLERYQKEITSQKRGAVQEGFLIGVLCRQSFSKLQMPSVTPSVVSAFRDQRWQKASPATVRRELAFLSHCFEIGRKEWGISVPNPVKEIRLPNPSRARDRRLAADEQRALDDALLKGRTWYLKPLVTLAVETAMRRGELLSLEWQNVCLERRTAKLTMTKNGDTRDVPLSAEALAILQDLPIKGRLVFPIKPAAVHQAWDRMTKKASLANFRFHDLRHEAISRFFERGLTVAEVAFISGHKDVRMLFRYTHMKAGHVLSRLDTLQKRKNFN